MKKVEVSAAIIMDGSRMLAAQRGYGEYKDGWEFPGGKLEPGESGRDACVREIREELGIGIECGEEICLVEWDYPKFHLSMHCYMSRIISGEIVMKEHEALEWITVDDMDSVAWLDADRVAVEALRKHLSK